MSYFVACFGNPSARIASALRMGLKEMMGVVAVDELDLGNGGLLLHGGVTRFKPAVHRRDDDGWLVADGVAIDVKSADGRPRFDEFLAQTLATGQPECDRYEGSFAVAVWDARRKQGWFFNDHASVRNLYYGERDGTVYATTAPVVVAKALGLELDDFGVKQLIARGCVLAPTSLFAGMSRLCVGEFGGVVDGRLQVRREWLPCREPLRCRLRESVEAFASVLTDRLRRLRAVAPTTIGDLTGGLDSRLVNLAQHAIGGPVHVMVNGVDDDPDVVVAKEVAAAMGWDLRHYHRDDSEIDGAVRQELSVRTAGELPFDRISFHRLTRPALGETFDAAYGGVGGELLRYYPWSHEFLNIGRRKPADVERTLRYRYSLFGEPPRTLFARPWFDDFQSQLADSIRAWFALMPGTLTTQQQDALYVWKMTSHGSLWSSSTSVWLASVSPLMMRGCIDVAVAIPWRSKLSSKLQRAINQRLSPQGAAVRTVYGASGGRWGIKDLPAIANQTYHQASKLVEKVIRVLRRKGRMKLVHIPPFLTAEFRDSLDPATMLTASRYDAAGLKNYVEGPAEQFAARSVYLARIATIESLARAIA